MVAVMAAAVMAASKILHNSINLIWILFIGGCFAAAPSAFANQAQSQKKSQQTRLIRKQKLVGQNLALKNYYGYQLRTCDLSRSQFNGSTFTWSTMIGCQAKNTSFKGIKAPRIRWENNDFRGADFSGANFFEGSLLSNDFRGANLKNIIYSQVNFNGSLFDRTTQLPFSTEEAKRRGMIERNE